MAFIYNLSDTWNDAATTWNGIKLAVTNTGSSASSNLLNLTVTGASTASFVVDKSGNLVLNGSVNKITMTAPATGATLTLADNSTFVTSGAYSSTFTFSGTTTLTFPTSGTVTALGNTTTGSGSIVLATSPTLVTPALGAPSSGSLANCTNYPVSALTGTGTGVLTALAVNVGSAGAFVTFNGALGTPSSGSLANCTGYPSSGLTGLGTGVATALAVNVGSSGAIVVQNGVLGTPSSGTLTNATGLPLTTGVTGTLPVANGGTGITSFGTGVATALGVNVGSAGAFVVNGGALGTPLSGTLTNATGLPIGTGVSGLGTGVATFLATPSSANLASAVTDETGSGPLVFATSPTFTSAVTLGTQSTTRGTLVLANTTAGSRAVTLQSSNSTAAAYTLTFPAAAPVNGYYLQTDVNGVLSWAAGGGGGGGSPGGSNTQVQFNDSATFGGEAAFTYDKTTYTLGLGVASTTTGIFNLYHASSANSVSLKSGNNASAWTLTLPTSGGTNNYALLTDGSGTTSWGAVATGTISTGTIGQITYYSGTNTLSGTTTGTGVLTAFGNNTNSAGGLPVLDGSGFLAVAQGGTATGTAGIGAFNNITGYTASGATGTTSTNLVFSTSPTITTLTTSGNVTATGTAARFLADFDNATVNSRFSFQTSTTNGLTGIYALPNGSATGAAWQATNNSDPTNASKIMITTNAFTDVQLVSGINGTGTYLPLSIYTGGGVSAQFSATKGIFTLGVSGSTAGVLNIAGSTSGTVSIQGAAGAGTYNFNLPTSAGTSGQPLLSGGGGASSMTFGTLGVSGGGTGASSASITAFNNITGYTASGATGTTSTDLVFSTSPTLVTPNIGVATATSVNGLTITSSTGTLTITNGKTASFSNTLTLAGTDSTTMTFPSTSSTVLTTGNTATITKGYTVTPASISTGSFTVTPANGNYQYVTNNGAYTITAPASDCAVDILVTNGASAGATTFSGFTVGVNIGSALTTTNTNRFIISVRRINSISTYSIYALQ